ncbi:murein biosynthesis integral membrane protein MurJ [Kineococcus gynurae]|uniref:Murein biosynthesis integral membrane protein MurJ n=1 Tax=Kineococcus gynurae TaxID=452979 RepID=A0ABV5LXR0_9ACTN
MRPRTIAAAAASVALLTVAARVAGFGRQVAYAQTVGDQCLSTAYTSANQVPNLLFEIVAGGALAGVLVPLLSARLASEDPQDRAAASRTASAALTWSVLAVGLVAALTALLARPLMGSLLAGQASTGCAGIVATGATMLLIFLPQVPLYAVAVVLAGVLQAQQRFTAPAAAPLVSSLVVAASYLLFGALVAPTTRAGDDLTALPPATWTVLAGGTTLGVLALALTHAPALRSGVRWRPTLRAAPGDGPRLRSLALSGLAVVLAQQVVTLVVLRLTNAAEPGALPRWSFVWALFLLPYAVLAVPIATAVFPRLARAEGAELSGLLSRAGRTVLLSASLGAALLVAAADPLAGVFLDGEVGSGRTGEMVAALVVFAPGLLGYGVLALWTRALYVLGAGRAAAAGTVAGWASVAVLAIAATRVPGLPVVPAVAGAHTLGLSLAALLLGRALHRRLGPAATAGGVRAVAAGTGAAVPAALAGLAVAWLLPDPGGLLAHVLRGAALAVPTTLVWIAGVSLLARADVRELRTTLRRGRGRSPRTEEAR